MRIEAAARDIAEFPVVSAMGMSFLESPGYLINYCCRLTIPCAVPSPFHNSLREISASCVPHL